MDVPDHGPLILAVSWGLTVLGGSFLGLRIYAKLSRRQGLWWDDYILIISWLFLLAQTIATQLGVMLGFGKRLQDIPPDHIPTILLGSAVMSTVSSFAATLSKMSFGVTLLRLTSGYLRWTVWFCTVTLFIVMVPSAVAPWVLCPVESSAVSSSPKACWDTVSSTNYGIFNAAWCATADFVLALMPWCLIWNLQLKFREKIGVSVAMSMGMLAGICAIVKGVYVVQLREKDFSYNGVNLVIWTVTEIATAIVGGSIPVLRVFFKETISSYGQSGVRTNAGVQLSRMNKSQHSTITTTVRAVTQRKDGSWTTLAEDSDGASQRGILEVEEMVRVGRAAGDDGILQTSTVTVTVDKARSTHTTRSFLSTK